MKIQLNWAELLFVVAAIILGVMMLIFSFKKENTVELFIFGLMNLFAAGIIILKKRVRINKGLK